LDRWYFIEIKLKGTNSQQEENREYSSDIPDAEKLIGYTIQMKEESVNAEA